MPLDRDTAWTHLCAWTLTDSLRKHARAVEIVMRSAAERYGDGADVVELWGLAGLLHDADYERWPEDHPVRIVAWLEERGEDALAHAIAAHCTHFGVPCESLMDRALVACDELSGFVIACSLVRPEGIETLGARSVKKKLKTRHFAAAVDRGEVDRGAQLLGVELGEHIDFVIGALRPHADELGIGVRT